jgi:hypothetical protein
VKFLVLKGTSWLNQEVLGSTRNFLVLPLRLNVRDQ